MNLSTSFNILGIGPETDEAQAKQAYKARVRRWHPDQFPEGSATKGGAEERLKLINIAYARVKAHLAMHRPNPTPTAPTPPERPDQGIAGRHRTHGEKADKRSWVDHLFDALNAFSGNRTGEPWPSPADETGADRRKTFGQVLDEMAGGAISPTTKRQSGSPAGPRRTSAGYRHGRRGSTVGAVDNTKRPGPVKPVSRVRGIGRSR